MATHRAPVLDREHSDRAVPDSGVGSLAPIWRRAVARLVDTALILFAVVPILSPFVDIERAASSGFAPVELAVMVVVSVLYTIPPLARWGRTPGRWLLGIRVVTESDPSRPPDLGQASIRTLVPLAAEAIPVPFGFFLLGFVFGQVFTDPIRRGVHDRAAGTIVVRCR